MYIGAIAISIYAAFAIISKNKVNMATNDYGSAPVFEIMALCGVVGVVAVCKALSLSKIRNTWGGVFRTKHNGCLCVTSANFANTSLCWRKIFY